MGVEKVLHLNKMAEYSFLEISYDPNVSNTEDVHEALGKLGFIHRSQHRSGVVGFWTLRTCLFMLRTNNSNREPYVSGVGFIASTEEIEYCKADYEADSGFNRISTDSGLNIYLIQESQMNVLFKIDFVPKDTLTKSTDYLNSISGIVFNCSDQSTINKFVRLGFKLQETDTDYDKLTAENKQFTIMVNKSNSSNSVSTLICDTHDVFKATAYYGLSGFDMPSFKEHINDDLGRLNFKVNAYDCKAWGNENSYTIENFLQNVFPGIDIIYRQRKQYLHIQELTLKSYYLNEQ